MGLRIKWYKIIRIKWYKIIKIQDKGVRVKDSKNECKIRFGKVPISINCKKTVYLYKISS